MIFTDDTGKPVFTKMVDPASGRGVDLPPGFQDRISQGGRLFRHAGETSRFSGIVILPDGPVRDRSEGLCCWGVFSTVSWSGICPKKHACPSPSLDWTTLMLRAVAGIVSSSYPTGNPSWYARVELKGSPALLC